MPRGSATALRDAAQAGFAAELVEHPEEVPEYGLAATDAAVDADLGRGSGTAGPADGVDRVSP